MPTAEVGVELAELLTVAVDLAHGAGTVIRDGRDRVNLDVSTKSSPTDLVTAVDRLAERYIVMELGVRRPDDAILGEEEADQSGSSGVRWLVDPIDGTVNFYYGLPQYSVSVAAERDGVTLAGCVHNPVSGETFMAVRGGGAWVGSHRLTAAGRASELDHALIGTGFGYEAGRRAAQGRVLAGVLPRVANVRRLGSAALDLCFVAAGRLDGYYEQGLSPWDMAAGALIAEEAGARVTGLHGRPPGQQLVVAATPAIAADFVTLLEELGADEV